MVDRCWYVYYYNQSSSCSHFVSDEYSDSIQILPSTLTKIAKDNGQMNRPSPYSSDRETILKLYQTKGYPQLKYGTKKVLD